jgi:hypothetical protein
MMHNLILTLLVIMIILCIGWVIMMLRLFWEILSFWFWEWRNRRTDAKLKYYRERFGK